MDGMTCWLGFVGRMRGLASAPISRKDLAVESRRNRHEVSNSLFLMREFREPVFRVLC
jgi:hypothetical protein